MPSSCSRSSYSAPICVYSVHTANTVLRICRDALCGWIFWPSMKQTDANVTEPGDEYEKLNETYVIFITEHDVLGDGHPIYHIDRTVRETGALFGDESHILYVNAQIKDDTALGQLMHDFSCTSAEEMHYQILADRVRYFKEDTEGVATMCKVMEDMRNEAAREADKARMVKIAQRMLNSGKYTYEDIADVLEISVDEVKTLTENRPA